MAQCRGESVDGISDPLSLKRKRDDKDDVEEDAPPTKQANIEQTSCTNLASSSDVDHVEDSSPLYISSDEDLIGFASNEQPVDYITDHGPLYNDNHFTPQYDDEYNFKNYFSVFSKNNLRQNSITKHNFKRRKCPFPCISWANQTDVWDKMCEKDREANTWTSHDLFNNHPGLQMRMRAILLDWIMEVCEVYKLCRETFHLTVNYIDRYLSATQDVYKGRLQLIGITCLFIAAKVEEIYPPKITEFAYVTDGACSKEDILSEEIVIMQTLHWRTTPSTIDGWLNIYMQLHSIQASTAIVKRGCSPDSGVGVGFLEEVKKYTFIFPQYSSLEYVWCGQLIDLAVLHVGVNAFPYSVVAAAAFAHVYDRDVAMRVSSYNWDDLETCYEWLRPFAEVLESDGLKSVCKTLPDCGSDFTASSSALIKICPNINSDQGPRIQVHNICLEQFDKAQEHMEASRREKCIESTPTCSVSSSSVSHPITPPYSNQKLDIDKECSTDIKSPIEVSLDK